MMWITWMRRFSLFLFSRALTREMMKLAWLSSQSLFALLTSCWFCCGCVFLCWTWGPSQLPHFSGFIIIIILIMRWDSSAATDSSMIKVVFVFIALHPLAWLKLVSCCYLPLLSASLESCKESAVVHLSAIPFLQLHILIVFSRLLKIDTVEENIRHDNACFFGHSSLQLFRQNSQTHLWALSLCLAAGEGGNLSVFICFWTVPCLSLHSTIEEAENKCFSVSRSIHIPGRFFFTAVTGSQCRFYCVCEQPNQSAMPLLHHICTFHYFTIVSEQDVWKGNKNSMIGMIFKITESAWETFFA